MTDPKDSNPNAGGRHGLEGDMGVSSERSSFEGVEGTGTVGSAVGSTDGEMSTTGVGDPTTGMQDRGDDLATEENTAEVAAHEFDAGKHPGHSHG